MNLTTVATVKSYLGIVTANQDTLIGQLITRESAFVEQWTGRVFPSSTNTSKRLSGAGTDRLVLGGPLLSVSGLSIGGVTVEASADGIQAGYLFDDTCLYLIGGDKFPRQPMNVVCSWAEGYQAVETGFVPTGNTPTITPTTGGTVVAVVSVVDSTGVVLTQTGAAPLAGEFSFSAGVFTFNSAQYNDSVTMTYNYVPASVEQAVIEMVSLDLQQRSNIGITSKSLAGESISYERKGMTDSIKEMLMPYRRMVTA
jgi:hypothetical protein